MVSPLWLRSAATFSQSLAAGLPFKYRLSVVDPRLKREGGRHVRFLHCRSPTPASSDPFLPFASSIDPACAFHSARPDPGYLYIRYLNQPMPLCVRSVEDDQTYRDHSPSEPSRSRFGKLLRLQPAERPLIEMFGARKTY